MSYTAPGVFPIGLLNWYLDLLFAQNGPAICPIKYSSIFQAIISSLSRKYSVVSYPGHQLPLFPYLSFSIVYSRGSRYSQNCLAVYVVCLTL